VSEKLTDPNCTEQVAGDSLERTRHEIDTDHHSELQGDAAYDLFELGWSVPDVTVALGIPREVAETICHQYLEEDAETKCGFRALLQGEA
jgi:hypothetical protein